jgi:hypothetical protein
VDLCEIVQAGAIEWCGTHNRPAIRLALDGVSPVCRLYIQGVPAESEHERILKRQKWKEKREELRERDQS